MLPNHVMVTGVLAACADLSPLFHGKEIHGFVIKNGFDHNVFVSSALVDMYGKCHDMNSATKVFDEMQNRNTVKWNALISGYIHNFDLVNALKLIPEMLKEGVGLNLITLLTVLPACQDLEDVKLGRSLHGLIVKVGFFDLDDSLANVLIDMYTRFSSNE
ncbi:hypothetical protein L1987_84679 [Smallanthus sonchifolius]|uniref:Uncharacterized protein n=1 Tax=Smallanthus sonchifolius TaxID=185202 RepID=A0ACB8XYJ7_9ASTR|nr:hypothetical protein L1987_84679 [Smallanthus sonchifolius]